MHDCPALAASLQSVNSEQSRLSVHLSDGSCSSLISKLCWLIVIFSIVISVVDPKQQTDLSLFDEISQSLPFFVGGER